MRLLLARHGNTFAPGDKIVWAGSSNDLALVDKGLEQAHSAAEYLLSTKITPKAIYCSPLQRTKKFAEIIIEHLGLNYQPIVDARLNEIDYGEWTGLSDQEIIERFGEEELKKWSDLSQWPNKGSWGSTESAIREDVKSFVDELQSKYSASDTIMAISSNGRLRYFLTLIDDEFEKRREEKRLKVKTGHLCELSLNNGSCTLSYWDKNPGDK